jgi:hypothetical protein
MSDTGNAVDVSIWRWREKTFFFNDGTSSHGLDRMQWTLLPAMADCGKLPPALPISFNKCRVPWHLPCRTC